MMVWSRAWWFASSVGGARLRSRRACRLRSVSKATDSCRTRLIPAALALSVSMRTWLSSSAILRWPSPLSCAGVAAQSVPQQGQTMPDDGLSWTATSGGRTAESVDMISLSMCDPP